MSSPFDGWFDVDDDVSYRLRERNRRRREQERRRRERERRAQQEAERRRKKEEARIRREREEQERRRREEERRRKIEEERRRKAAEEARKIREAEARARALQKQAELAAETRALREAKKKQEEVAMLKRAEETRLLREQRKEDERRKQEQLCSVQIAALRDLLSQTDTMELSEVLKDEVEHVKRSLEAISSTSEIASCSSMVSSVVSRCAEHEQKIEEYLTLKDEYEAAATAAGEQVVEIPFDENAERLLRERLAALEEKALKESKREYIHQAMDEEMRNMGYRVVGSRDITTPYGVSFKEELYQIEDDGVVASVIYQSDGMIAVEIGGLTEDAASHELLGEKMTDALEEHQQSFCSKADQFEKNMAARGVVCNISRMPPDRTHAPLFCVKDYEMKVEVGLLEERQGRFSGGETAKCLRYE